MKPSNALRLHSRRYLIALSLFVSVPSSLWGATEFYVATTGSDTNAGTLAEPFKTLTKAKAAVRAALPTATDAITVSIRGGTYYLSEPLEFGPLDSGSVTVPITYSAHADESVTLSGAIPLNTSWSTHSGNILVATIGTGLVFDMLFVDGEHQVMARYPNFDPDVAILNGYAGDATSASRASLWSNPSTGFVRGLHGNRWGGNSFRINGLNGNGTPDLDWVGDNNRGSGLHSEYRMVENLFEELDAPGEWFYDEPAGKLYFHPPSGIDPGTATFEAASLEELIRVVGNSSEKVQHLTFTKLTYTHTHRTLFTRSYEPMNRSDWRLVRAGAVFIQDAEHVTISDSVFDQIGGNGVFMSAYNRDHLITNNEFLDNGATCVNVCGSKSALWDVNEWDNYVTDEAEIDINTEVGPKTDDYPKDITISYNHMFNNGRFEKQTSGVNLFLAESITISHNTIHSSPRSGINICDGAWGGHVIEFNDVFDCIRETHDHGPFNSWGRDRFYSIGGYNHNGSDGETKRPYAFLEAWKTTHIRNNRFHYDEPTEFGIDLDDGSSNYHIYNNLILNTSVKLREGFSRKVYNNIMINRGLDLHVWYNECRDELHNNIIVSTSPYNPINVGNSAEEAYTDYNVFYNNGEPVSISSFGWFGGDWVNNAWDGDADDHSVTANPLFTDVNTMDYSVQPGSPALALGFVNFPMDQFGKPGAPEPDPIEFVIELPEDSDGEPILGAIGSSIYSVSIQSSLGSPDQNGIYFEVLPPGSNAEAQGFEEGDAIRSVNGTPVTTKQSFWLLYHAIEPEEEITVDLLRNQEVIPFSFVKPAVGEELNDTAGILYTGDWTNEEEANAFNGSLQKADNIGDAFELTFYGTGVKFTSQKNSDMGLVDVFIDGELDTTVDLSNGSLLHRQEVYAKSGLVQELHTLRVVNKENKVMSLDSFTIEHTRNLADLVSVQTSKSSTEPTVSNSDLAETWFLSSSATGSNEVASEHGQLFNGVIGNEDDDTNDNGEVTMTSVNTFTVTFDTTINSFGYDISRIDSYFGWNPASGGRSNQGYSIRFDYVDGTSETIPASHWEPNSPSSYWTTVSFTNTNGGALVSGVESMTFDIANDSNANGVLIAREIDVIGVPSNQGDLTPLAHWKFDETSGTLANDATGHGFHGNVTGGSWTSGLDGGALDCDGGTNTMSLPSEAFAYINQEITFALWVDGGDDQPQQDSVFYAEDDAGGRVLNIHIPWSDSTVYWDAGNNGTGSYDRMTLDADAANFKGRWNHWVFTKNANSGVMAIYLNGELQIEETGNTQSMSGVETASIASRLGGSNYSGKIDDVRLYASAMNAQDVKDLYDGYVVVNGVPQIWLYEHGLETTDAGALSNTDGDWMLAWQEYAAGTDPTSGESYLSVSTLAHTATGFDVEWTAVDGKTYDVWFSTTLQADDWALVEEGLLGASPKMTTRIDSDSDTGFVRISVR